MRGTRADARERGEKGRAENASTPLPFFPLSALPAIKASAARLGISIESSALHCSRHQLSSFELLPSTRLETETFVYSNYQLYSSRRTSSLKTTTDYKSQSIYKFLSTTTKTQTMIMTSQSALKFNLILILTFVTMTTLRAQSGDFDDGFDVGTRGKLEICYSNEQCSPGLYCSFTNVDSLEGRCADGPSRSCRVNNRLYYEGESFERGCMEKCTCLSGRLACTQACPNTIRAQAPKNCLHARLIRRKNPCCLEWTCDAPYNKTLPVAYAEAPARASRFHSTHKVRRHRERSANTARDNAQKRSSMVILNKFYVPKADEATTTVTPACVREESEWSTCSKTCGWGLSFKYSNDNADCKKHKITRFCQIRPCDQDLTPKRKRGKKCNRVARAPRRVRFSYKGCKSKSFLPKYCGQCVDGRCCQVKNHVTESVSFNCADGSSLQKDMMIIKSCECRRSCRQYSPFLDFTS